MQRIAAGLPESVAELCLVRLGLRVRRVSAFPFARRMGRAIDRSAAMAIAEGAGLLHSERLAMAWDHFGVLQYWRGFEEMEAWSHRPPHADWWREAVERMRARGDFGIYHETFLVPRDRVESIYLNCPPTGLSNFGVVAEADGPLTTSRDRLGRRGSPTA